MKKARLSYFESFREIARRLPPEIKPLIKQSIERLINDPYAGKELVEELAGYRSLAVGKYRVLYRLSGSPMVIEIRFVGHRRDVYIRFKEMLESSLSIH